MKLFSAEGAPHLTVDDFVLRKPPTSTNRNSVQSTMRNRVQYQSVTNNTFPSVQ